VIVATTPSNFAKIMYFHDFTFSSPKMTRVERRLDVQIYSY